MSKKCTSSNLPSKNTLKITNKNVLNSFAKNPCDGAMALVEGSDYINWEFLSSNPNDLAIQMLKRKPYQIDWNCLSTNPSDKALDMIEKSTSRQISWTALSENPNMRAVRMIQVKPKYALCGLLTNPNKEAIDMLKPETCYGYWYYLSGNPKRLCHGYLGEKHRQNKLEKISLKSKRQSI